MRRLGAVFVGVMLAGCLNAGPQDLLNADRSAVGGFVMHFDAGGAVAMEVVKPDAAATERTADTPDEQLDIGPVERYNVPVTVVPAMGPGMPSTLSIWTEQRQDLPESPCGGDWYYRVGLMNMGDVPLAIPWLQFHQITAQFTFANGGPGDYPPVDGPDMGSYELTGFAVAPPFVPFYVDLCISNPGEGAFTVAGNVTDGAPL